MAETSSPSLFNWFQDHWQMFSGIIAAFLGSLVLAFKIGQNKNDMEKTVSIIGKDVEELKRNQIKTMKAIPRNVFDGKDQLVTAAECVKMQTECGVHVMATELTETMHIVKQAVSLLIIHNDKIPQEERDKVIKGLVR